MTELFLSGDLFMWPILVGGVLVLGLSSRSAGRLSVPAPPPPAPGRRRRRGPAPRPLFGLVLVLLALVLWFVLRAAEGVGTSGGSTVFLLRAFLVSGCGADVPDHGRAVDLAAVVRDSAGIAVV